MATSDVPAGRLILLACATAGANTVSLGAFPALLPDLGRAAALADWQLGAVAGAFGFARMVADIPVGLFVTHHLRRAFVLPPAFLVAGALIIATGSLPLIVLGRALMGVGHTLGMMAGLTAILRFRAGGRLASGLNAFEFSAMIGMLAGVGLVAALPGGLAWNATLLVACAPLLLSLAVLPALLATLPRETAGPLFARGTPPGSDATPAAGGGRALAALAFAAGGSVALAYSTVEQFLIPLRGSREFGLERGGIARLLSVAQIVDLVALLPVGRLADRRGTRTVMAAVLLAFAGALALVAFGSLPLVTGGCVLFGLGMAGWMLPLGLLRSVTPAARVAWRTALYRVCVDGGIFLGPFLSGLLAARAPGLLPGVVTAVLAGLAVALLVRGGRRG